MADKRPALGRGLSALIPHTPAPVPAVDRRPNELDIDLLTPNPLQPRQRIDEPALDELAQSIRSHGVIQPILVAASPSLRIVMASAAGAPPNAPASSKSPSSSGTFRMTSCSVALIGSIGAGLDRSKRRRRTAA
jgi:ParB family chromosome partitioning protein